MDMSLSADGDRFCKVSYQAGTGKGLSTLTLYDIASKQTAAKLGEVEIDGEFPIGCSFIDGDRIALLTNNAVHIYDKNCKETEELTFYGESIRAFEVSADGVAVVTGSESEKNVRAFDKKGNLVYNSSIAENVSALSLEGGYLFMRTATGVIRIDIRKEESEFLACDNGKMLVYGEDTAMVCGDARAEYLVFGKKQ
jgi:WD40 repeat protein